MDTPTPMLLGAAASAVVSLAALGRILTKRGVGLPLIVYTLISIGFSLTGWGCYLYGYQTLQIEQIQGCILAMAAWGVLSHIHNTIYPGTFRNSVLLGIAGSSIASALLHYSLDAVVTGMSLFVFAFALYLMFRLFYHDDYADIALGDIQHFWILLAFLVQFPSQVATANWIYLTVNRGATTLIWLFFAVSALPTALSSLYLLRSTKAPVQ